MESFLTQYGLIAAFLCALVESDVTFVLAGAVIHRGLVHPGLVLLYCVAGALGHDLLWFWLGHSRSDAVRQSGIYRRLGPFVERVVARIGIWELFFCRFVYGTRNPSLVFWGLQRTPVFKFVAVDALALTVWGGCLMLAGYVVTNVVSILIGRVHRFDHLLLGTAMVVVIAVVTMRALTRHEIRKRLSSRRDDSAR